MIPDVGNLILLQGLDQKIAELQREISALPKHIATIEKALEQHLRKLEADRAALAGNQKDRKKLDQEVQVQNQKISKLKDQMLEARTNEQYRAFQHEIEYCMKEIRKAEDRTLDLMAESEPLEANVAAAEKSLAAEKRQVEGEKQKARERTAADQKSLAETEVERRRIVSSLNPQVHAAYERIRKKRKGVAVAEAVDSRCSACQIALRPQFYQDLRRGEQVMMCESCGCILYCNPPVVVDEDTGALQSGDDGALPAS